MIALLVLLLLALPGVSEAQNFTRGNWQTYGTGTFASNAVWRVAESGAGGAPPYDQLLTSAGGLTPLSPTHNGQTIGLARGQTGGPSPFLTWDTSVWDSNRRRLIVTIWGGDAGESSNEVNEWDWATGTWNPDGRPMHPTTRLMVPNGNNWPLAWLVDSTKPGGPPCVLDVNSNYLANVSPSTHNSVNCFPMGRHTYGGMTFMPTVGKLWAWGGGADWQSGTAPYIMTEWATATKKWQMIDGPDGNAFFGGTFNGTGLSASTWDSTANRVLFINAVGLWAYNPSGTVDARTTLLLTDSTLASSLGHAHMVFVPSLNRAFLLNGGAGDDTVIQFDFSGGHTNSPVKTDVTSSITGTKWVGSGLGPGALYDPIADRVIVWFSGQTLYSFNPSTYVSTSIAGGGTNPGTPPQGIWSRFWYVAGADVYAEVHDPNATGVNVFAPVRSPKLLFTDLSQGKRTGNKDTSMGQTANVNGAWVTVWGTNLGSTQGSSTITIGGVAPTAVQFWGNATAPNCGASNLSNQFQKLQCVIFQVASTTPTGSQNIVATVNGTSSTGLPFTVTTTGNIFYAGTSGTCTGRGFSADFSTVQAMLNAMDRLDIGYICDGLNATNGVTLPTPNTRFDHGSLTDPFSIVAYPGASVQIGDATHTGFQLSFSGTGYGVTYAKISTFGNSVDNSINAQENGRIVGMNVQAPNLNSTSGAGAIAGFGSNLFILGNELTNVASSGGAQNLDHGIYLGGRRNPCPCSLESNREIGWNYIHDNRVFRGVNLFNGSGTDSNPISDHVVHDNVIINQDGDGILFGRAVVGVNSAYNNLIINAGLNRQGWGTGTGLVCINLQMSEADGGGASVPHAPTVTTVYNNTMLNCGQTTGGSDSGVGALMLSQVAPATFQLFNNIFYQQASSFPYVVGGPTPNIPGSADATKYKNNSWFGVGVGPSWDTGSVITDPKLVSAVSTYDLHLQATSPVIGKGTTHINDPSFDFDGFGRPIGSNWDLGAYQSGILPSPIFSFGGSGTMQGQLRFP